jgi:ubiquinone/menaquinone biosynthesis C-methylase UbiE
MIERMRGDWVLDELAHAGAEHCDPGYVAGFDRKQGWPDFSADVAVLREHGVGSGSTVVDLGAGTGRFALAAAPHVGRVVAVDVSAAMLGALSDRVTAAGCANVETVHAGFLSYQHAGSPADAVFTRNALHQLPDFWKAMALHRMAAMLRPGGVLRLHDLIFDFQPAEAVAVLGRWMDRAETDPLLGYTRDDYAEHLRTEFSTFRWLLEPMLITAGFEIVTSDYRDAVYGAYTCVKG